MKSNLFLDCLAAHALLAGLHDMGIQANTFVVRIFLWYLMGMVLLTLKGFEQWPLLLTCFTFNPSMDK